MNPIGPRETHILEQIQALVLEVSAAKKALRDRLVSEGFSEAEAWQQAGKFEELTLGKALDEGRAMLPIAEEIDRFLAELMEDDEV